jgi:hypothetical protein
MVEVPQDVEDLRRLIARIEEFAAANTRNTAICRDLLSKLRLQLAAQDVRHLPAA